MTHPTDDELEAMAQWHDTIAETAASTVHAEAAAMLRACKGGAVKVKALEWHQNKTHGSMYDYRIYAVHQGNKYGIFSTFLERDQWGSRVQVAKCVPLEAAKAAAQADYEARILSAFEPTPDARQDGWRAGMEAAAKVALNASLANGESPLQLVGDEARGFAMGISGAHAAIRALAEKGPTNE